LLPAVAPYETCDLELLQEYEDSVTEIERAATPELPPNEPSERNDPPEETKKRQQPVKSAGDQRRTNPEAVGAYRGTPKAGAKTDPKVNPPKPAAARKPADPAPRIQVISEAEAIAASPSKRQKVSKDTVVQISKLETEVDKYKAELAALKADHKRESFYQLRTHQAELTAEYAKGHANGYVAGYSAANTAVPPIIVPPPSVIAQHHRNGYNERHRRRDQEPQP
jgi:hypothetical protein